MEQTGKDTMIPYIVYESMLAKEDTQQKRMVYVIVIEAVIILAVIALLVANEYHWRQLWNEYDYVDDYSTEVDVNADGQGNANYIGNDGDIYNGKYKDHEASSSQEGSSQ